MNMAVYRRISNVALKNKNYFCRSTKCFYSTGINLKSTVADTDDVIVPYRIQRGPTDILKALASTISKDCTAPQFKYEDDPYFIPVSNVAKRAFALSKESGKKAARYFLETYPELFMCNTSAPHVKAFDPPITYTIENVSSVDPLVECIHNFELNNAISIYEILKKKDIALSQSVKQDLLELLCFYNGTQQLDDEYYEDKYFQRNQDQMQEKWNSKGMAEQLFEDMEKDSKAYSALIAGVSKFRDSQRAMDLFDEMKSNGLTPTVEAYNALLSCSLFMFEIGSKRWEYSLQLLNEMHSHGLKPDLYTMNEILKMLTKNKKWRKGKQFALSILAEMKRLNIEPSLGTYSHVISIYSQDEVPEVGILYSIIDEIEGKEHFIRHPSDLMFFRNAMEMCWRHIGDKNLAYRINGLLEFKNNCKLLGNALSESIYFKNFLRLLCTVEDLDTFMENYERYVPNTYTPEPSVMFDILENIHLAGNYKYLPKLCSDVLVFEHTERENVLSLIMEAAGFMKHDEQLQKDLVHTIWNIVEKQNMRLKGRRMYNFQWTGQNLGYALNTFLNGNDLEKSWAVMKQLFDEEESILGYPEQETLLKFCELFLENEDYDKVNLCIKYSKNGAFPNFNKDFKKLTENMLEKQKLSSQSRNYVNAIINAESETEDTSSSSDSSSSDEEDNK